MFPLWQCSNPIDKTPIGGQSASILLLHTNIILYCLFDFYMQLGECQKICGRGQRRQGNRCTQCPFGTAQVWSLGGKTCFFLFICTEQVHQNAALPKISNIQSQNCLDFRMMLHFSTCSGYCHSVIAQHIYFPYIFRTEPDIQRQRAPHVIQGLSKIRKVTYFLLFLLHLLPPSYSSSSSSKLRQICRHNIHNILFSNTFTAQWLLKMIQLFYI